MNIPQIKEDSTIEDLMEYLKSFRVSKETCDVLRANEVDGFSFFYLTEQDMLMMLPGKVGAVRKILTLRHKLQSQIAENVRKKDETKIKEIDHFENDIGRPSETFGTAISNGPDMLEVVEQHVKKEMSTNKNCSLSDMPTQYMYSIEEYIPPYSTTIKRLLDEGEIYKEWDKFIEETAYHVLHVGNFASRGIYQDLGRLIHSKWPCIGDSASKEPWGVFKQKLSNKVRNIRWKWNVREKSNSDGSTPKRKKIVSANFEFKAKQIDLTNTIPMRRR